MTLRVIPFVNGIYHQNCYIVANLEKESLIIDPGSDADGIVKIIDTEELSPIGVLCTHAHFDHVGAVADLMERYDIPFFISGKDSPLLRRMNLYKMVVDPGAALRVPEITRDLVEVGETISLGHFEVKVIDTPGHTAGGVCFLVDNHIFTGDTILPSGVGRIDLPGGDPVAMSTSVDLLVSLPGTLDSHPGHGSSMPLIDLLSQAMNATRDQGWV